MRVTVLDRGQLGAAIVGEFAAHEVAALIVRQ
jgi:hypothetical protein